MVFSPFMGFFSPSIDSSTEDKSLQVHSFSAYQPFSSHNFEVVNFLSLLPPLPTGKLPQGSECQLYGCALTYGDSDYYMIEGERCNISLSGEPVITSVN